MKEQLPKIEKITIRLSKDKTVDLSVEEARMLYFQLKDFFDSRPCGVVPMPYPVPSYPIYKYDIFTSPSTGDPIPTPVINIC